MKFSGKTNLFFSVSVVSKDTILPVKVIDLYIPPGLEMTCKGNLFNSIVRIC